MEQEFFDQAAQRWQDMVFRLALHQLGSYADADDAVQEVFLRLWRQKAPFESEEHLRRWLLRVTVNWCRDQLRSPWRRRRVDWDSLENQPAFETPEQGELYEAVMSLPEKYLSAYTAPEVRDPIKFLREREIVHFQRFGESLRRVTDSLDSKNFYAVNPSFDRK